jgi:hypothetical protein
MEGVNSGTNNKRYVTIDNLKTITNLTKSQIAFYSKNMSTILNNASGRIFLLRGDHEHCLFPTSVNHYTLKIMTLG